MNILIADENSSVRFGLAVLLDELPQARILGKAATFKDLLLLGWELADERGVNLLDAVRLVCPHVYIIVMSSQLDAAEQACELGADAFISKTEPPEKLLDVIKNYSSK